MSMMYRELSRDILYFCVRLLGELEKTNQKNVFFLAREGQILKEVFDLLVVKEGADIRSHYKKVSRASTFLPSLAPLEAETFETLFRQYRSISISDFLNSLGFGYLLESIVGELNCSAADLQERLEDLPTSDLFERLRASNSFKESYTRLRSQQQELLSRYFLDHLDDCEDVCVVDVGWKGTIQDHLAKALNVEKDNRVVRGYYLGLLYPSNLSKYSFKSGLIFSRNRLGRSKGFWCFNENRALFELLLSANHGSALKYEYLDNESSINVELQPFVEKEQYSSVVKPIQDSFLMSVKSDLEKSEYKQWTIDKLIKDHSRMVFSPTQKEIECFEGMFQYENFGVFENTFFLKKNSRVIKPLALLKAIAAGDESKFGFWPYIHIRSHYGHLLALLYKLRIRFFI